MVGTLSESKQHEAETMLSLKTNKIIQDKLVRETSKGKMSAIQVPEKSQALHKMIYRRASRDRLISMVSCWMIPVPTS